MGKKSKKGHTRHAQHEHHRSGEGTHHHHKLTVHGHHEGDHDDALLDQLLDAFDVTQPDESHHVASTPSDGKIKQSHFDQTPETVASTPPRENEYLQNGQEDEILDKLLDEFDDPNVNQKSAPQTPQRKDEVPADNIDNVSKSSVVTSPRAYLGDVSDLVEEETAEPKTTPIRSLHYMSPTSTSLSKEAQARKVRDEQASTASRSSEKVSSTPVRSRTKGTPHYMLPTSLSLAREHHEDNIIGASKSFDAAVDKSVKSRSSKYSTRSTYSHFMAPTANSQARDIHASKSYDEAEKPGRSVKSSSSASQIRYSHFMAPTETSQRRDLHNAPKRVEHSAEKSVKSNASIARSTTSSHYMAPTATSRARLQQPTEDETNIEKSSVSIKSNVKSKSGLTLASPFNLRVSARAKEREERQKYFAEVAERAHKEKVAQMDAQKKRVRSQRINKDLRPSLITAPPKKPTAPGKPFGLHSAARAEVSQREIEQREARRAADEAARARKKRLPAEFDPKTLWSFKLHEESVARQKEMQQLADKEPLYKPFHSRPVPKTTYEPKPISSHQDEEPEWYRKYHKSRLDEYERIKKKEEEQSNPTEWKPLPVPETTYKEQAISTHLDEALARAKQRKEERMRKQQLAEDEKKKALERGQWRARPVPETTYRRPRDLSPHARASIHRFEEEGEKKRQEAKRKKAEAGRHFRARPLPGTYSGHSAAPVSKSEATSTSSVASFNRHADGPCITKPMKPKTKESFHARPIPKTTYEPTWVEPRSSQSISSGTAKKSSNHFVKPAAKKHEVKPVAKPVTSSTVSKPKGSTRPKPRPPVMARGSKVAPAPAAFAKAKSAADDKNSNFQEKLRQKRSVFKARPMPKSTTQGFRPVAAQKPTSASTRSKSKSTARPQATPASRPVVTKASFTPLDKPNSAVFMQNGDSPNKGAASEKNENPPASFAPSNTSSSIFSSTSAFSQDGPGKQQSEDERKAKEILQNLDQDPNAEISFGQDDDDDELAAILDEGPTGEVTAEITFTASTNKNDGNDDSFEELAAIFGDDPFGPSEGAPIQDEHDAELAAILDD